MLSGSLSSADTKRHRRRLEHKLQDEEFSRRLEDLILNRARKPPVADRYRRIVIRTGRLGPALMVTMDQYNPSAIEFTGRTGKLANVS